MAVSSVFDVVRAKSLASARRGNAPPWTPIRGGTWGALGSVATPGVGLSR
jgi:hypothetical protein